MPGPDELAHRRVHRVEQRHRLAHERDLLGVLDRPLGEQERRAVDDLAERAPRAVHQRRRELVELHPQRAVGHVLARTALNPGPSSTRSTWRRLARQLDVAAREQDRLLAGPHQQVARLPGAGQVVHVRRVHDQRRRHPRVGDGGGEALDAVHLEDGRLDVAPEDAARAR